MKKLLFIAFLFISFSGYSQNFDFLTRNGITKSMKVYDSATIAALIAGKQPQLNGTGFVKAASTTISYDNSTYVTSNIYTADGTLGGDRNVDANGHAFTMNNGGSVNISSGTNVFAANSTLSLANNNSAILSITKGTGITPQLEAVVNGASGFGILKKHAVSMNISGTPYYATLDSSSFKINADSLFLTGLVGATVDTTNYKPLSINSSGRIIKQTSWPAGAGGGGANALGTYLVQTSTNAPANAQIMGSLGTGIVKNTTTTGVQSIATAGTDYTTPAGTENLQNKTIIGALAFSPSNPAFAAGTQYYDSTCNCLIFRGKTSSVSLNEGQELWEQVYNNTGSTIPNGSAVYVTGGVTIAGEVYSTVALAKADAATTVVCIGLATEDILTATRGMITTNGTVHGLNTSGLSVGNVFLSSSVAGGLTNTAPSAPNFRYRIGVVSSIDAVNGTIKVTGSTGALGNGTANQVFGMNNAGTAQEVKSITGTTNRIVVNNSANTINIDLGANVALQDANKNVGISNSDSSYATIATAAGTTTLTVSSKYYENFTGSTTQTVVMPAANTLVVGHGYYIVNKSTGIVTVNYNGGTLLKAMAANTSMSVVFTDVSTSTGVATVEYSGDVLQQNNDVAAFAALGGSIKAQTVGNNYTNVTATVAMADQQVKYCAIFLDHAATLTGVKVYMKTAGSYTGDQYNGAGLYTYSGGSLTLVASSTNSASLWTASANTILSIPFSSTYPAQPGIYFIGMLYNQSAQTTAPALAGSTAYTNAVQSTMDFTNSAKLYGTLATQNSLPSPQAMSGVTATTAPIWAALY